MPFLAIPAIATFLFFGANLDWNYAFNPEAGPSEPTVGNFDIFYPDTDGPHYVIDISDGCAQWASNVLTSTGGACGSGSGGSGLSSSTPWTAGYLAYVVNNTTIRGVATTSLTINAPLTTSGTPGALVGGTNLTIDIDDIKAADLDLTDITLSDFTNDAGFTTFAYPFPAGATTTPLSFGPITATYASTTGISSPYASSTNLVAGNFTFGGVTGNSWDDFCTAITGDAGLCDGSDDGAGGGGDPYPFKGTGNSTSTLTQFNGGLTAYATSTIGNGAQIGGLTVSGGATTTGTTTLATNGGNTMAAGRILQVGSQRNRFIPTGGPSSAFFIIDKNNSASDASILISDQGDVKWEIGAAGGNDMYWKKVTGTEAGGYTFENSFFQDYETLNAGIGTEAPTSKLEIASTSPTARVDLRVTNKSTTGTDGTSLQLVAENNADVFYIGTDAGLNGNKNAFMNWGGFGTGLFFDSSARIGINTTSLGAGADLTVANASTSVISAGTICFTGDTCRTTWPSAGSSFSYPFPNNATSTLLNFNGGASTTLLSAHWAKFGATASTTIDTAGNVALPAAGTLTIPALTSALLVTDGGGLLAEYAGSSCTNQSVTAISALGVATCNSIGVAYLASADFGDWTCNGSACTIDADSIALATDTTGNYVATVAGTAQQISVSGSGSENAGVTLSLPSHVVFPGNYQATNATTTNATTTSLYIGAHRTTDYFEFTVNYSTTTQGVGTTTKPATRTMQRAGTLVSTQCYFNNFMRVLVQDTSGNRMNDLIASSTSGTVSFSTNQTFTAGETLLFYVGTTTASLGTVYGNCTFRARYD